MDEMKKEPVSLPVLDSEELSPEEALPLPVRAVSGTYHTPKALPPLKPLGSEELRLDVDGRYPLMTASGVIRSPLMLVKPKYWIAKLEKLGTYKYKGPIWYKNPATGFDFNSVTIEIDNPVFATRQAVFTFTGVGLANRVVKFDYASRFFHPLEIEIDAVDGVVPQNSVITTEHPNHPAGLPTETLNIFQVYQRAGFDVRTSGGDSNVPLAAAKADGLWEDIELNDAMAAYWSHYKDAAQWAIWLMWAGKHKNGYLGIMFDYSGTTQRQGAAVFKDLFDAPPGDPKVAEWLRREHFWCMCHEAGHCFNLFHPWIKSAPTPWIPLTNDPESRSFMNYDWKVTGGQAAYFKTFEYRFSNPELLFMRHAPDKFVEPGNEAWGSDHGFEDANLSPDPKLQLTLRVNRDKAEFEFLEPIVVELKLKNISAEPQIVDANVLTPSEKLVVAIEKEGAPFKKFLPYAKVLKKANMKVLMPGESIYESMFVSAGKNGFDLSEPGKYNVRAAIRVGEEDFVSEPMPLRIAPPKKYEEEHLAQDFFTEDVGRVLAFDGSRYLTNAMSLLHEMEDKLGQTKAARHARVALGCAYAQEIRQLDWKKGKWAFVVAKADEDQAHKHLLAALESQPEIAAQTLGHIDYHYYVDRFCEWLVSHGEVKEAARVQEDLLKTLTARKVAPKVIEEIAARSASFGVAKAKAAR